MVRAACQHFSRFLIVLVAASLLIGGDDHKIANLTVCGDVQKADLKVINEALVRFMSGASERKILNADKLSKLNHGNDVKKYFLIASYDEIERFGNCLNDFPQDNNLTSLELARRFAGLSVPILGVPQPVHGPGTRANSMTSYVSEKGEYVVIYIFSNSKNKVSSFISYLDFLENLEN